MDLISVEGALCVSLQAIEGGVSREFFKVREILDVLKLAVIELAQESRNPFILVQLSIE